MESFTTFYTYFVIKYCQLYPIYGVRNLRSLIVGLVAIINILYWRKLEEDELESSYGETYLEYRKRTWF